MLSHPLVYTYYTIIVWDNAINLYVFLYVYLCVAETKRKM